MAEAQPPIRRRRTVGPGTAGTVGTARDGMVRRHAHRRHRHRQFVVADGEWMESSRARRRSSHCSAPTTSIAVDDHSPHLLLNTGILLRPVTPDRADAVAADLMRLLRRRGRAVLVVLSVADEPAGPHGGRAPAVDAARAGRRAASRRPRAHDRGATTREALGEYEQVLVDGFPLEALQPWRAGVVFHPATLHVPGTRFFVGRVDGRPVSAADVDRRLRSEPRRVRGHPARRARARLRRGGHVGGHAGRTRACRPC